MPDRDLTRRRSVLLPSFSGVELGTLSARAATKSPRTSVYLDQPLDLAPALGLELDHATIARLIDQVAWRLAARGIAVGQRIAIVKANNFDLVILAAAVTRVGAVPALLSSSLSATTLAELTARMHARFVVTDPTVAPHWPPDVEALGIEELRTIETVAPAGTPHPGYQRDPDALAVITHTSGTTGVPKLVGHSMRSILAQGGMQVPLGRLLIRKRDVLAACLPWCHARALAGYVAVAFMGRDLLALSNPDPASVGQQLLARRPIYLEAVPDTLQRWEALAIDPSAPLSSVRLFYSTFDAVHPRTVRQLLAGSRRRLALYAQVYAQSETAGVTVRFYTRKSAAKANRSSRDVGRPLWPFVRMRVVDGAGKPLGPGKPGTIQVQSPGLCLGYIGEPETTALRRRGAWWDMTDRGHMTRGGSLVFLDRVVEATDRTASTIELEDVLLDRLPACEDVIVVPDERGKLGCVLVPATGRSVTHADWRVATAGLPFEAAPRVAAPHSIPRTPTGKVKRAEVRKILGALPTIDTATA